MKMLFALLLTAVILTGCGESRKSDTSNMDGTVGISTSESERETIPITTSENRLGDIIDGVESAGEDIAEGVEDAADDIMDGFSGESSREKETSRR